MSRRLERDRSERCDRWQQVQGGQHPTQELHAREGGATPRAQLEKRVAPYLMQLDTADLQEPSEEVGLLETRAIQPPPTPGRANRVGCAIRKMFNLAIRWEMRTDNPATGFIRNPENPRERFLDITEIGRLSQIMNEHRNQRMADVIRLLMLTGARRGDVLNATWDQFDLDRAAWTKPAATTKQRKLHRTPISSAAVQLYARSALVHRRTAPGCFPVTRTVSPSRRSNGSGTTCEKRLNLRTYAFTIFAIPSRPYWFPAG